MRTAKLSWVLFVLALFLVGPVWAEEKDPEPKKLVYQGKTVEQWIAAVKDKDELVRESAITALGKIGPAADKAVPALLEAFKEKDEDVRKVAQAALKKIQKK
jgi:hypothetical protein